MPLSRHTYIHLPRFSEIRKYVWEDYVERNGEVLLEVHHFGGRDTRDDGGWREQNQQSNKQYASIEHE